MEQEKKNLMGKISKGAMEKMLKAAIQTLYYVEKGNIEKLINDLDIEERVELDFLRETMEELEINELPEEEYNKYMKSIENIEVED